MNTCFDVANYFLKCQDSDAGDLMSNMKLQKLVYYAQGFHLAIKDRPLFDEPIMAWEHGPVCVALYKKYKKYGGRAIPIPYDVNAYDLFDKETRDFLENVNNYYGQYSAWKLRNMTHLEPPWLVAYHKGKVEISLSDMKAYFKTQLDDEDES